MSKNKYKIIAKNSNYNSFQISLENIFNEHKDKKNNKAKISNIKHKIYKNNNKNIYDNLNRNISNNLNKGHKANTNMKSKVERNKIFDKYGKSNF